PATYPLSLHDALPISSKIRPSPTFPMGGANMKTLLSVTALLLNFVLIQMPALADLPAPRSSAENPNIAAARKAIDAKDFKTAVGDRKSTRLNSSHVSI